MGEWVYPGRCKMASLELLEGRMQYAPTAYRQEAFFLMVDWRGSKYVTGKGRAEA